MNFQRHRFFTLALNWRQLGHGKPCWACSAWIWPNTWRGFMRSIHSRITSCGNRSHLPSLEWVKVISPYKDNKYKYINSTSIIINFKQVVNYILEMIISINCLVTLVAEILPTVLTHHLVATFSFGNCHLTRRALLSITEYCLDTKDFIYHFTFFTLLILL